MKRLLPLLMLLVLPATFAGCSMKHDFEDGTPVRMVTYAVNGESFDLVLRGDTEWDDFIVMLFDKVGEGYPVLFQCTSTTYEQVTDTLDAKRPLSFKTGNRREAEKWASERGKEGYVVIVSYDKKNKVYKLQALKK